MSAAVRERGWPGQMAGGSGVVVRGAGASEEALLADEVRLLAGAVARWRELADEGAWSVDLSPDDLE